MIAKSMIKHWELLRWNVIVVSLLRFQWNRAMHDEILAKLGWNLQPSASDEIKSAPFSRRSRISSRSDFIHCKWIYPVRRTDLVAPMKKALAFASAFFLAQKERLARLCLAFATRTTDCVRLRRVEFESLPMKQKNKPYTPEWLYRIYLAQKERLELSRRFPDLRP